MGCLRVTESTPAAGARMNHRCKKGVPLRFHDQIIEAITYKRVLMLHCRGYICVVEPHAYGADCEGRRVLLCYQTYGRTSSGWKVFFTDDIGSLHGAGAFFETARAGYTLDRKVMHHIYAKL